MKSLLLMALALAPISKREFTVVKLVLVKACNCSLTFTANGKPALPTQKLPIRNNVDTIQLEIERQYSGFHLRCANGQGDITVPYTPGKIIWLTANFSAKPCK